MFATKTISIMNQNKMPLMPDLGDAFHHFYLPFQHENDKSLWTSRGFGQAAARPEFEQKCSAKAELSHFYQWEWFNSRESVLSKFEMVHPSDYCDLLISSLIADAYITEAFPHPWAISQLAKKTLESDFDVVNDGSVLISTPDGIKLTIEMSEIIKSMHLWIPSSPSSSFISDSQEEMMVDCAFAPSGQAVQDCCILTQFADAALKYFDEYSVSPPLSPHSVADSDDSLQKLELIAYDVLSRAGVARTKLMKGISAIPHVEVISMVKQSASIIKNIKLRGEFYELYMSFHPLFGIHKDKHGKFSLLGSVKTYQSLKPVLSILRADRPYIFLCWRAIGITKWLESHDEAFMKNWLTKLHSLIQDAAPATSLDQAVINTEPASKKRKVTFAVPLSFDQEEFSSDCNSSADGSSDDRDHIVPQN